MTSSMCETRSEPAAAAHQLQAYVPLWLPRNCEVFSCRSAAETLEEQSRAKMKYFGFFLQNRLHQKYQKWKRRKRVALAEKFWLQCVVCVINCVGVFTSLSGLTVFISAALSFCTNNLQPLSFRRRVSC